MEGSCPIEWSSSGCWAGAARRRHDNLAPPLQSTGSHVTVDGGRSEERRVGKECRGGRWLKAKEEEVRQAMKRKRSREDGTDWIITISASVGGKGNQAFRTT